MMGISIHDSVVSCIFAPAYFVGTSPETHESLLTYQPMTLDPSRLPGQARYWTLHCCINALPSFIVATAYLKMIHQPVAVVAMLLAVLTFIGIYTVLTSIEGLFSNPESLLSRALKAGVKFRLVISLVSLPLLLPSPAAFLVPDVWAGMLALGVVNWCGNFLGFSNMIDPSGGSAPGLAVYATTMIEGIVISFMLFMISFFALLYIQSKERKKQAMEILLPPEVG
jgi:hypothetical protein